MSRVTCHATLVVPGLLDVAPEFRQDVSGIERLSALELLLARADCRALPIKGFEAMAFSLFGVEPPPGRDLPVAAVTRVGETGDGDGDGDGGWWLRADPVHLYPDRDRLLLLGAALLQVRRQEADVLMAELNDRFREDGWRFEAPLPGRWYLRLPREPGIVNANPADVIGHDIHAYLPRGTEQGRWRGVFNEIQMLLHASAVNRERELRGEPAINSVWFWGGGRAPEPVRGGWDQVLSPEPLVRGLARLAGLRDGPLPPTATAWLEERPGGECLLVLDALPGATRSGDPAAWAARVAGLEKAWFEPLLQALKTGLIESLEIIPANGPAYRVERGFLRRWWRRRRRLFV